MFKFCQNNVLKFFMKFFTQTFVISILAINLSFASKIKVFDFTETELSNYKLEK